MKCAATPGNPVRTIIRADARLPARRRAGPGRLWRGRLSGVFARPARPALALARRHAGRARGAFHPQWQRVPHLGPGSAAVNSSRLWRPTQSRAAPGRAGYSFRGPGRLSGSLPRKIQTACDRCAVSFDQLRGGRDGALSMRHVRRPCFGSQAGARRIAPCREFRTSVRGLR